MLKKQILSDYFRKREDGIEYHLKQVCLSPDEEELHKLRLDIKKARSLANLIANCSPYKGPSGNCIKSLNHRLGAIRTAQINIALLTRFRISNVDLEEEQYEVIENESYLIADEKERYLYRIKKLKKEFTNQAIDIKAGRIFSYYLLSLDSLAKNFKTPIDPNVLHKCRKLIKDLLYPMKIMSQSLIEKINIDRKYLKKLEETIGSWHDANVLADLISESGAVNSIGFTALIEQKQKMLDCVCQLTESFNIRVTRSMCIRGST